MNKPLEALEALVNTAVKLHSMPHDEILQNGKMVEEMRAAISAHNIDGIINGIARDYETEREYRDVKAVSENSLILAYAQREHKRVKNVKAQPYVTQIVNADDFEKLKDTLPEKAPRRAEQAFSSVFNSVYSNGAVKINTPQDPTVLMSYIDYSPYRVNYTEYLSVPTLSELVDRPISMAMKNPFEVKTKNERFKEILEEKFKQVKLQSVIKDMLFNSVLSPRGSLLVPIQRGDEVSFNVFNDTQFAYGMGSSYGGITQPYDSMRIGDIYCMGAKLKHGVSAFFNCPGFEPLFGVGLNRVPQLRGAAEAWNLYLHIIKTLLVRAQVIVNKMDGDIQTDTKLAGIRANLQRMSQTLGIDTPLVNSQGMTTDIMNNNINEGMGNVAPVIQSYASSITGVSPEYFFGGGNTNYSQAAFQIAATNENVRARYQIAQIEPMARFVINTLIRNDADISGLGVNEDDFDIDFESIYDETDQERVELASKRTETLIRQREYPELEKAFKHLDLLDEDVTFAGLPEPAASGCGEDDKSDEDKPDESKLTKPLA